MSGCLKFGVGAIILVVFLYYGGMWALTGGVVDWIHAKAEVSMIKTVDRLNKERPELIWSTHVSKNKMLKVSDILRESSEKYKELYGECKIVSKLKDSNITKAEAQVLKTSIDLQCKGKKATLIAWFRFKNRKADLKMLNFMIKEGDNATIKCPLTGTIN